MSLNIFPEKIVKTRGTSGGYMSEIYDINTWGNLGFIGIVFVLIIVAIFAPVFAGLILLYQCITKNDEDEGLNIFSILCSVYILFDLKKEWVISIIMMPFYDASERNEVVDINFCLILTNVVFLFFGGVIFNIVGKSRFIYFILVFGFAFFTYLFFGNLFNQIIKIY